MYFFSCVFYALFVTSTVYGASIKNDFQSALLGPKECLDSSYWCTNFTTAVQCNSVKHCIQTVWQNSKSVRNSCGDCESEIQSIRDSIDSNITKAALDDLLSHICDLNPITEAFRRTCIKLIDQYVDANLNELLDLLSSEVDGSTICHLLGFCSTSTVQSAYTDDAIVRYDNIELHFPASYLDLSDMDSLLGANRCTWGPSYWCNNISSSRECSSISHCVEEVWPQSEFPEDNDSVCQICKDMVKQARDQLQSNETQEELEEVFEGSCKLIPIKPITKECIALVDDFIPELTEMLVSSMNPTAVCSVAGLCNSPRIDKLIATSGATNDVQLDSCANCSVAFASVEKYLHNTPKVDVMGRLIQVCGELSSFSDSCSTLIAKHFDDLYNYLMDLQPWNTCHLSGMCASKYHLHPSDQDSISVKQAEVMLASQSDDLPCDLCKQLVTHFKDVLVANTTEEEFLQVLKGICQQTGKFKSECLDLVEGNFKIIYNFLTQELDPPKLCAEVNLCPRTNYVSDTDLNLIQSKFVPIIATDVEIFSQPKSTAIVGTIECRFCKYVIQIIQSQLENKEVKADLEKIVKEACVLVPSSDKAKCNKFIDQYAQFIIDLLADETDPGVVCSVIDLCPDVRLVKKFAFCPLCQNAIHFIQTELEDPRTEQQIEDAIKKVCTIVPQAEARQCNEFVSQYTALIISVLGEEIDPSLVCPALKLCPALSTAQGECQPCADTMYLLIDSLKARDPLHVYRGLKNLVQMSPQNLTTTALQLKIEHGSEIVDMMMAEFNAEESCTYMKYCNPAPKEFVIGGDIETNEIETSPSDVIIKTVSKPSCEVCELFVKLYENKLTSKTTQEELEQLLTKYCDHLTDQQLRQNCTVLVDKYVPQFFELLKKDVQPKELCQLAKICPLLSGSETVEKCRSCEATLGSLQGILADPYMMNIGLNEVDKICSYLNPKNRNICNAVVLQLGRQIEGILLGIPSWYYCSKLHMCPYSNDMILSEECTKGESFWCRGEQTAIACDKLQYCQANVWKSDMPSRK